MTVVVVLVAIIHVVVYLHHWSSMKTFLANTGPDYQIPLYEWLNNTNKARTIVVAKQWDGLWSVKVPYLDRQVDSDLWYVRMVTFEEKSWTMAMRRARQLEQENESRAKRLTYHLDWVQTRRTTLLNKPRYRRFMAELESKERP